MKLSRRGQHAPRAERSKAAHNAVNRGRRSQTSENMGRRATAAHWRGLTKKELAAKVALPEADPAALSPEELEWLRRKPAAGRNP